MRRLERNRARAEEEESVFVTMTDMTISFLLIIMILLAFFATQLNEDDTVPLTAYESVRKERDGLRVENQSLRSTVEALEAELARVTSELETVTAERDRLRSELDQLRDENEALRTRIAELEEENEQLRARIDQLVEEIERLREDLERLQVVNPLEAYLLEARDQRDSILEQLEARLLLEFPELEEVISIERDALRFRGDGLFAPGRWDLPANSDKLEFIQEMGRILDDILTCFTLGVRAERGPKCESGNALIEAVQIEGHTDSDPGRIDNISLSTNRANQTFFAMREAVPGILTHANLRGQPVMSVSGYGEMRPIEPNETTEGKAANRRIDLRIIMYAPSTVEEVEEVGRQLDALRAAGGSE